jgi:hypothetical protein
MGQTIAGALIEEGFEKGELKGQLLASKDILRRLLEKRFGTVPANILHQIDQATDLERLQAAALAVGELQTPDELRL